MDLVWNVIKACFPVTGWFGLVVVAVAAAVAVKILIRWYRG